MIVLHCDGLRPDQHNTVKKIDDYHRSKGWKGIGYHFWVNRQGEVFTGRRLEVVGAHVVGHNSHSIGICYEGGLDAAGVATDTRTPEQVRALRQLVERMHRMFPKARLRRRGRASAEGYLLAEGVGEDDQGDHDDGEDDNGYLQVLLEESAELNGSQALFFEDRCAVSMMMMMTHFKVIVNSEK